MFLKIDFFEMLYSQSLKTCNFVLIKRKKEGLFECNKGTQKPIEFRFI